LDKAGALGIMATILGKHGVSVLAATQKACDEEDETVGYVPIVMLTHTAREADVDAALRDIFAAGVVNEPPVKLRMI